MRLTLNVGRCLALVSTGLHGAAASSFIDRKQAETHTACPASGVPTSISLLEVSLPSGVGGVAPGWCSPALRGLAAALHSPWSQAAGL